MLGDYLTSLLRTAVPTAWGSLIFWLVSNNLLPDTMAAQAESFGVVAAAVTIGVYYALARWLETQPWFPVWLSTLLLGSGRPPAYQPKV